MSAAVRLPDASDRRMWRRVLARLHPDAGGDGEAFAWAQQVRERVEGCASCPAVQPAAPAAAGSRARIPFPAHGEDFDALTLKGLRMAGTVGEPYGGILALLAALRGCYAVDHGRGWHSQQRGASFKQLAKIAHMAGLSRAERVGWYEVAASIPLSERHASYLIGALGRAPPS